MSSPQPNTMRTISVVVGPPTFIGTVTAGSLIYNSDESNSIWVGGDASVQPDSNGFEVGPLGSMTWQGTSNVWAVLDTGVTTPVVVNITDMVTNPQSPLAVAEALIAAGVPSKLLINHIGLFSVAMGPSYLPVDMSQYASVFLFMTFPGSPPTPYPDLVQYQWQVSDENEVYYYVVEPDFLASNVSAYIPGVILPVMGSRLTFNNPNPYQGTLQIWGLNRSFGNIPISNGFQSGGATFQYNGVLPAAGGHITIALQDGLPPQGPCMFNVSVSYPAAVNPHPRWFAQFVPPNLSVSGVRGRPFIGSGQVQGQTEAMLTDRAWFYTFQGVAPSNPYIIDIFFSSVPAPPTSGNTVITFAIIPAGGYS